MNRAARQQGVFVSFIKGHFSPKILAKIPPLFFAVYRFLFMVSCVLTQIHEYSSTVLMINEIQQHQSIGT